MIKLLIKKFLPNAVYNFIRMRPRILIVSESLKRKVTYINRVAWQKDPDYRGDNSGALRKYGHMIDKGLQAQNRKAGHSLPVAERLNELLDLNERECDSLEWVQKILSLHEDLQTDNLAKNYSDFRFVKDSDVTSEQLMHLFKERRTLRHFHEHEAPSLAAITKILQATIWAPSSCNRQTIVNYFTLNEELVRRCTQQNKGATAVSGKHAFVSVCYDTRSYHLPQESLTGMIDASLGFQNALLMAHSVGLGACVLNWSHADKKENDALRYLLNIPEHCEIAFNVIIGIPNGGAPTPGKKSTIEFMIER